LLNTISRKCVHNYLRTSEGSQSSRDLHSVMGILSNLRKYQKEELTNHTLHCDEIIHRSTNNQQKAFWEGSPSWLKLCWFLPKLAVYSSTKPTVINLINKINFAKWTVNKTYQSKFHMWSLKLFHFLFYIQKLLLKLNELCACNCIQWNTSFHVHQFYNCLPQSSISRARGPKSILNWDPFPPLYFVLFVSPYQLSAVNLD